LFKIHQKVVPPQKKPKNDNEYFEVLSKAVFNAGFSWKVVRAKWGGIKEVFSDFDPNIVSKWTIDEITKALESPKIIRNSKKVNAIVSNAKIFLEINSEHGSFKNYLKSFEDRDCEEKLKILSKKFKWLGPTGSHFFLWAVGEDVPPCDQVIK
jgi:3-methyladenine DNA glycosylase Tag